jgi:hypothetical protein
MPKNARLDALLRGQDYVLTRDQAIGVGLTRHAIANRREYDGWQALLPQVYLAHPGEPSRRQLLVAALLYAGPGTAIDDVDAARFHGLRSAGVDDAVVHVVAPHGSPARSRDGIRVRRSAAPITVVRTDLIRYVDPAAALIAMSRRLTSPRRVLAVLSEGVQRRMTTYEDLMRAHVQGSPRRARFADEALAQIGSGVRSEPEATFRLLAEASVVLPPLLYNCTLRLPSGRLISPDALAVDAGLVHETNGRTAHSRLDLFEDMQARHDEMTEAGLTALHNSPARISRRGREVIAQFERCYLRLAGRGLPPGVELLRLAS